MTGVLVPPTVDLHGSFLAALAEFQAEGRLTELDAESLRDAGCFANYVAGLHAEARSETPRPANWVPGTTLWYVDEDEFVGTLQIRHWLTDQLREVGGHIGYEVRPSARRRGHATRMLALALPIAHDLGIDPALVTCDETNVASRKVIEANGGQPATTIPPKLRYWIATS
jgi:predicted acetyltransferase